MPALAALAEVSGPAPGGSSRESWATTGHQYPALPGLKLTPVNHRSACLHDQRHRRL